jgi:hypothetical protein
LRITVGALRVALEFEADEEPEVLLLNPQVVRKAS